MSNAYFGSNYWGPAYYGATYWGTGVVVVPGEGSTILIRGLVSGLLVTRGYAYAEVPAEIPTLQSFIDPRAASFSAAYELAEQQFSIDPRAAEFSTAYELTQQQFSIDPRAAELLWTEIDPRAATIVK